MSTRPMTCWEIMVDQRRIGRVIKNGGLTPADRARLRRELEVLSAKIMHCDRRRTVGNVVYL